MMVITKRTKEGIVMGMKKWAYSKPKAVVKNKGVGHKVLNGLVFAGTKVGQWTVRPGVKAYEVGKGGKK
jgi:hypothetical protein